MKIHNPIRNDSIVGASGNVIKMKLIETGAWNMDTIANKSFAHGLTFANIIVVEVIIVNDDEDEKYVINCNFTLNDMDIWYELNDTNVIITRAAGGYFDNINFDDAVINRGLILLTYIE